ncbi:acyltransferase family protein [Embleya sp. NPDC050493]|uniref:acyltransferase family protein n=1 Tax=Embleya sp. NPDC050493 TaxID=3363989 RepID=UPI0037A5F69E
MSWSSFTRSRGSLEELFSGRQNSVGFIRLGLALAVVLSHSRPLGVSEDNLGLQLFDHQTDVGTMSVYGFFVLSGLLITRSSRRGGIGRYAWHRGLRIFPGLWVCLLVTAFVVAPLVAMHENGTLNGFWHHPQGPFDYARANWWTGVRQYGISDLLKTTTPWGERTGASAFNGSLWSLAYEMLCYIGVGILAFTGVFGRARRFVLFLTLVTYLYMLDDYIKASGWSGPPNQTGSVYMVPLIGELRMDFLVYLGFLFLLGTCAELYKERLKVNDLAAAVCAVALGGSLLFGGFFVLGLPAYAYLLLWLAIRLPKWFHRIGSRNDYSYGIYIYGFLAQQILAMYDIGRFGFAAFAALSVVCTFAFAFVSWHLVEKPALGLKHWTPSFRFRRPSDATVADDPPKTATPDTPEPALAMAPVNGTASRRDAPGVSEKEPS